MSQATTVLLCGVGGQGTILAADLLARTALASNYDVKVSEIHGMSQRGGSVSSQVRYGEKVMSPVIEKGKADIIVSFEKMEALRALDYLKPDGVLVVNNEEIPSMSVITGEEEYPEDVLEEIQKHVKAKVIDATRLAGELGNEKAANMILLGTIIRAMGLEHIHWEQILEANIKPQFLELNKKALKKGISLIGD